MYIWTGLVFDEKSEKVIREICREINKDYGLSELSFTLPQHISLKTSFYHDDYLEVIEYIKEIFCNQNLIKIKVYDITKINHALIWLDIEENDELRKMHELLNEKLEEKFNISLHGFDGGNFHFHSTLFQDENISDKHDILVSKLKEKIDLPFEINIKTIKFGISKGGSVGTFEEIDSLILNE